MKIFYYIKRNFKIQFNQFARDTSIPGYKFTNCYDNKLQQFFWHAVLNFNLMVAMAVGLKFWNQYENQAILPLYEIVEQNVKMSFPAVYMCLSYPLNPENIEKYRSQLLKSNNLSITVAEFDFSLQNAVRFQRATFSVPYNMQGLLDNIDVDRVQKYLPMLYYNVTDLLTDCKLQDEDIPCDQIFQPQLTLPGRCFVFNSVYASQEFHEKPMAVHFKKMSLFDTDWSLKFKLPSNDNLTFMIYIKHPLNVLHLKDFPNFVWRSRKRNFRYHYNIVEHYAESNIKDLRRSQRKCLFNDESFPFEELRNALKTNYYNQDYCLHYCETTEFVKRCQCLPDTFDNIFYPNYRFCSFDDLPCYEKHYLNIRQLECAQCLNNCNYTDYISSQKLENDGEFINSSVKENSQEVSIDLEYWPLLQFRTVIIFSTIEYLLSLVSIASLFLGTSFLTCIEAFYALFMRYGCSYYVNWNNLQKEFKKQDDLENMKPPPCINMSLKPFWKK